MEWRVGMDGVRGKGWILHHRLVASCFYVRVDRIPADCGRWDECSRAISAAGWNRAIDGPVPFHWTCRVCCACHFFVVFFLFWLLTVLYVAAKTKMRLPRSLDACPLLSCLVVPRLPRSRPIGAPILSQICPTPSPDPSHTASSAKLMSTKTKTMPTSLAIPIAPA